MKAARDKRLGLCKPHIVQFHRAFLASFWQKYTTAHSDPEKLATLAEEAQRIQLVRDLKEQRRRVQEVRTFCEGQLLQFDL